MITPRPHQDPPRPLLGRQVGPSWAQGSPREAQVGPKVASGRPKVGPRWLQGEPTWPQDGPQRLQVGPSWPQGGPREAQDGPKMAPGRAKMAPRWPQEAPSWSKLAPRWPKLNQLRPSWSLGGKMRKSLKTHVFFTFFNDFHCFFDVFEPRWPQDGPKMAPRWAQDGPDGPKMVPTRRV